jgi:hypothetical protein
MPIEHLGAPVALDGRLQSSLRAQVAKIHSLLRGVSEPKAFVMTVNAGAIPGEHWTQDRTVGGGRILGEACHFIDLLRFLAGTAIESQSVTAMRSVWATLRRSRSASPMARSDDSLLRQRQQVGSEGAPRSVRFGTSLAARQLSQAGRLRLVLIREDDACGGRTKANALA